MEDEKTQPEVKKKILRKLKDIGNSAENLLAKIAHPKGDLFYNPDKALEKHLVKLSNESFNDLWYTCKFLREFHHQVE